VACRARIARRAHRGGAARQAASGTAVGLEAGGRRAGGGERAARQSRRGRRRGAARKDWRRVGGAPEGVSGRRAEGGEQTARRRRRGVRAEEGDGVDGAVMEPEGADSSL